MGLDIFLVTDNTAELDTAEYLTGDLRQQHRLSRTFCNFMCRQYVVEGEAELEQIAKLVKLDLAIFHEMELYADEYAISEMLEEASTGAERERIRVQIQEANAKCENNIDRLLTTVETLIQRLSGMPDLPSQLNDHGSDTLTNNRYFARLPEAAGSTYFDNSFLQDLGNMKSFIEYAKSKGSRTVYFHIG